MANYPFFQNSSDLLTKTFTAQKIAQSFDDENNLSYYENLFTKNSIDVIRKAFTKTIAVPDEKIKKSRKALFNYLIKKYSHEEDTYSVD